METRKTAYLLCFSCYSQTLSSRHFAWKVFWRLTKNVLRILFENNTEIFCSRNASCFPSFKRTPCDPRPKHSVLLTQHLRVCWVVVNWPELNTVVPETSASSSLLVQPLSGELLPASFTLSRIPIYTACLSVHSDAFDRLQWLVHSGHFIE